MQESTIKGKIKLWGTSFVITIPREVAELFSDKDVLITIKTLSPDPALSAIVEARRDDAKLEVRKDV